MVLVSVQFWKIVINVEKVLKNYKTNVHLTVSFTNKPTNRPRLLLLFPKVQIVSEQRDLETVCKRREKPLKTLIKISFWRTAKSAQFTVAPYPYYCLFSPVKTHYICIFHNLHIADCPLPLAWNIEQKTTLGTTIFCLPGFLRFDGLFV